MSHSEPKYGPAFTPPPDNGSSPPDPDSGKDFSSDVPNLAVPTPWSSPGPPSFNQDPPPPPADAGKPPPGIPTVPPVVVNLASLRGAMNTMIADTQTLVNVYEDLRLGVFGSKDTVFGQNATVTQHDSNDNTGDSPMPDWTTSTESSPVAKKAAEFAASMNPAQEKALEFTANAIELAGQFIAAVDRAGQAYGAMDRKAAFPPTPDAWLNKMSGKSSSS